MSALLERIPSIRYLQISTRTHHDIALAAGLENAIGDFVILLSIDRDPVEIVPDLVNTCRQGSDIVIGVSSQKQTLGYQIFAKECNWFALFKSSHC